VPDITAHRDSVIYSMPIRTTGRFAGEVRCVVQCNPDGAVTVRLLGLEDAEPVQRKPR
jgi:hypothetical protein